MFDKEVKYIKEQLGNERWVKVYDCFHDEDTDKKQDIYFYCGLISNKKIETALNNIGWEIKPDSLNGFHSYIQHGDKTIEYDRFGFAEAEPLIFIREYNGFKNKHPEISEEFRFFHNLYYDKKKNEYVKFDESGEEETIIKFEDKAVLIRLKEIRQFLAIKECHLALFFEYSNFYYNQDISTIPEEKRREQYSNDSIAYHLIFGQSDGIYNHKMFGRIIGKKLISPCHKSQSGIYPYNEQETKIYEDFLINETSDGEPILFTCNPDKLANYFGANPDAPHYLTPVYFKREVLKKYYDHHDRFSVEDSQINCGDYWELSIDNHHTDYVIAYLGDLSKIPVKEQKHWKNYNVPPQGKLSQTKYMRDFRATPCDPEGVDLKFKLRYKQLNEKWNDKYGWYLFRELAPEDKHYHQNLRVPLNNTQGEFDSQILHLTKILIDALNEKEIAKNISYVPETAKGIKKFELFLEEKKFVDYQDGIKILRVIQNIRSSSTTHLKGKGYSKIAKELDFENKELKQIFADLLEQATLFLQKLIECI